MHDPLIQELFPEKESTVYNQKMSSLQMDSTIDLTMAKFLGEGNQNLKYNLDYLNGDYDMSYSLTHHGESCFPSLFARRNLLHLQILFSVTFNKDHYTKRKDLPSYLLLQTFFGKGILHYEQHKYELHPQDVFLIDCRRQHEYFAASKEGWGYRFLHFDGAAMPSYYLQILNSQNVKFTFDIDSHFQNLFKEIFLVNTGMDPNKEIITNRILTDMITEILCLLPQFQREELSEGMAKQCAYLQNHCREKLTLEYIAKEFKLSKYYMSREFKKYTGTTIFNYITDCRITIAQRLLRYGDTSISEIAEYVGFEDHNGFYRAFQQKEEMSPSAYRKYWRTL